MLRDSEGLHFVVERPLHLVKAGFWLGWLVRSAQFRVMVRQARKEMLELKI